jgi:hypothetical protein
MNFNFEEETLYEGRMKNEKNKYLSHGNNYW